MSSYWSPPGVLGIGLPFIIMVISYSLVYKNLSKMTTDTETWNQRRAVLILAFSYFIFVLPLGISELLPKNISDLAFIRVVIYGWYFQVYLINFLTYILFWRRIRTAMRFLLKDLMDIVGWKSRTGNEREYSTSLWWSELHTLSD